MAYNYFPNSTALNNMSIVTLTEIHAIELAIANGNLVGNRIVKVSGTTMTANDAGTPVVINFDISTSNVLQPNHGFVNGTSIMFSTTGNLPYPLTTIGTYYVLVTDINSYRLASSLTNVTLNTAISFYGSTTGISKSYKQSSGTTYYYVLNGKITDPAKYNQVTDVVNHFTTLSYNIQMVMDNTGVYWVVSW